MKNIALSFFIAVFLIGCGGSGGGSSLGSSGNAISGIASAGAPITDAEITVLSSNGLYYSTNVKTSSDGKFEFNIDSATYQAPYLLKITKQSGQSIGSYYAFVASNNISGLLVTPISNATLGLAANSNLDEIFASGVLPSNLNSTNIDGALEKIYAVTRNVFDALSVVSSSLLLRNTSYVANGEGQDSALDILNFNSASATNGSVLVGSKLTGTSVKVDNNSNLGSIGAIALNANGTTLLGIINTAINQVNGCIKTAINSNVSSPTCVDDNYLGSGIDKSNFSSDLQAELTSITTIGLSSVRWCMFDGNNSSLTFDSPANQLAGATGICNASFAITVPDGSGILSEDYKFTLNSSGTGVASVKAFGNQLKDSFEISPKIKIKLRVDGFTTNTGITSGYMFDIGTALQENSNGNPIILSTSNLSAKVEILNSGGGIIDTFYMQCQQGTRCIDSALAVCKNKNATCVDGVDKVADNIISVNSTLGTSIISALQQGFVKARVTAYNKVLSDNTKSITFQRIQPIIGLPISQDVASQLTPPSLTTASATALASWTGDDSLDLTFDRGDSRISLIDMTFVAQPSAAVPAKNSIIRRDSNSVRYSGLSSRNNSEIVQLTSNGCQRAQANNLAVWRGVYMTGTFANMPVEIKQFGSCNQNEY